MEKLFLSVFTQYGATAGGVIALLGFIAWKLWKSIKEKDTKIDKIIERHEERVGDLIKDFTATLNKISAEHREDHHKTEMFLQRIADRIDLGNVPH